MADLPETLPDETQEVYRKYLDMPLADREALTNKVQRQLESIEKASDTHKLMDVSTADCIGDGLLHLIRDTDDELLHHVQAAAYYFASNEDLTPDIQPLIGFDDDAQVFNAVCRHLNSTHLLVPV